MNIYEYEDIAKFLRDSFSQKLKNNAHLSLKAISNKIGLSSASAFNQMLRGQRPVPAKFIPLLARELKLNINEVNYFNELYLKSKSHDEKSYINFLKKINPKKWRKKILKTQEIPSPIYFAMRTFLKRKKNADLPMIDNSFSRIIDRDDLKKGYDLLKKNIDSIKNTDRIVAVSSDDNSPNLSVQEIHHYYLKLAEKSLKAIAPDRREFNTYSININEDKIPMIKQRVRFFFDSLIEEFGNEETGNATFQIGGYFYPLTKEETND